MKLGLINGSPKRNGSASGTFLDYLAGKAKDSDQIVRMETWSAKVELSEAADCDAVVVAFPLYVDGIPGHLLQQLEHLEQAYAGKLQSLRVYTIINCGFYEGSQAQVAMDMMRVWCNRIGAVWGQGVAIGGGGMTGAAPLGNGPLTTIGRMLDQLWATIEQGQSGRDLTASPDFPRRFYIIAAHMGWRSQGRKNGLGKKQLQRGL